MSTLTRGEAARAGNSERPARSTPRTRPRIAIPIGVRRAVLVLHLLSAAAWIGIDVIVAVLVLVGWFAGDTGVRGLAYQALGTFVVAPMLIAALACLISGLVLGLGTKWGLVRYWWVLIKLSLNVALCTLILVALNPGMDEVVAAGTQLRAVGTPGTDLSQLFFPPAVSLTTLSLAVVLSVYKPWGRVRRQN